MSEIILHQEQEETAHSAIITSDEVPVLGSSDFQKLQERITELEEENQYLRNHNQQLMISQDKLMRDKSALMKKLKSVKESKTVNIPDQVKNILAPHFTSTQIDVLLRKRRPKKWSDDDIALALSLRSVSIKAYRFLRSRFNYPLPCLSTLNSWVSHFACEPGILSPVFKIMNEKAQGMSLQNRLTVLSFDEMKVDETWTYDKKADRVYSPHKYVQVVMARGLVGNWKQPIFYKYDCKMTTALTYEIISMLEASNFTCVAIVSDMGGQNMALWKSLGINMEQTWFRNPCDDKRKIFVFADAPHLIKLVRNQVADSSVLKEYLDKAKDQDLSVAFRLYEKLLHVKGEERQRVKYAVKLLSNSVSSAVQYFGAKNMFQCTNWQVTADVIGMFNKWFDVMNSRVPVDDTSKYRNSFSGATFHTAILEEVISLVSDMRIQGRVF